MLSNNGELLRATKQKLDEKFKTKDLGEAQHLLGLRVSQDEKRDTVWLDQECYVEEILRKLDMEDSKVHTPENSNQKLSKEQCPSSDAEREEMRKIPYREAVGSLIYATRGTRLEARDWISRMQSTWRVDFPMIQGEFTGL